MNKVVFFWNDRMDGGVHLGLEANDVLLFDELREGPAEPDPALNWFIDIKCESQVIPRVPSEIREWFLKLAPHINDGLDALTKKLEVGMDGCLAPFSHRLKVERHPAPIKIEIKGSALRSIRATEIARHLLELKKHWQKELGRLPAQIPTHAKTQ